MAPNREALALSHTNNNIDNKSANRLSMESLQRTISDIAIELRKEAIDTKLPSISEVEDAKCECCGMCEECTPEYIHCMRNKFSRKLICGLCAEAVKEETEKNGGNREEALSEHMSDCLKFNRLGRTHPVLYQAEDMRELLKKSCRTEGGRAKSISPKVKDGSARSSSCILTIRMEINSKI